ncbi:NADPH:quinone reductase-like Zn-dependent oxidoreductase [Saccharothrix ecbatanensis]|uniref:NADPH:quinone reductase-like Zn-dependent oxidoreductase n=1 Tax=Saccharothrix ecbatanensis TaxID=1105145 RepID=A0A7W9HGU8_9PSEU|nr:NADP-dependent oxidoreductase [Saccharothrix ecbatanensis]MBB5801711.1 NADPH:quinone reductase-like Zn-dependent oxidoreductase [Saccharothrix ecbatanensis]
MKAVVLERFGGPEELRLSEVARPEPGPGQVRVHVRTAGVNPFDGKVRSGSMEAVFRTSLPTILGSEVAGVVDAVGPDVTGLAVGDAVFGFADSGSYAEYTLATSVARKPEGLSWEHAVTLPVAGETTDRVLRLLDVQPGETLLVHGAAGGVGSVAVQVAVAAGLRVIGTAGPDNQEHVAALGATPTTYGEGLVERVRALAPEGIDAVFDVAGKGALPDSIELRGGTDRIVTIADSAAGELGVVFTGGPQQRSAERLAELADLAVQGKLRTTVAATFPLAEAAEAHRVSGAGHVRGKIVLTA